MLPDRPLLVLGGSERPPAQGPEDVPASSREHPEHWPQRTHNSPQKKYGMTLTWQKNPGVPAPLPGGESHAI